MTLHINSPLLYSSPLQQATGNSIWLKMDALQPSGSFKIRGIGLACEQHAQTGAKRFISSSGGNAGMAVAYAGKMLTIPVLVVVPETTSKRAQLNIKQLGAEIIVRGASWKEANEYAQSCIGTGDVFIHPFDNPLLWTGHASLIDEVVSTGLMFDAVMLSVGGGGLYAGVVEGLRRNNRSETPVIVVETEGAASFNAAMLANERVELAKITSIATSLGAKQISEQAFRLAFEHPTLSLVVSDALALQACRRFLNDHRVLIEPACGATLAPLYFGYEEVKQFNCVLAIVCGGAGVAIHDIYPDVSSS
jgi:L-serine/L-threonine ammonia-lyase